MAGSSEIAVEHDVKRAQEFAHYVQCHAGPLGEQMRLTQWQAILAFTYLLAESLSRCPKRLRQKIIGSVLPGLLESGVEDFQTMRIRNTDA